MKTKSSLKNLISKLATSLFLALGCILLMTNSVKAAGTLAQLANGPSFNATAEKAAGSLDKILEVNFETWNSNVPASGKADIAYNVTIPDPSDSSYGDTSIYMWFDSTSSILHITLDTQVATTLDTITFSQDCGRMFEGMENLTAINIEPGLNLNLSNIINTSAMFRKCGLAVNNFFDSSRPASNIRVMQYMYADSTVHKVDVTGIDTAKVYPNGMTNLFKNSNLLDEITLGASWDFKSKTDFEGTWKSDYTNEVYDVSTIETQWSSIANNSGNTVLTYDGGSPSKNNTSGLYEASGNHFNNIWALSDPSSTFTAYCIDKDMIDTETAYSPGSGAPHGYYRRTDDYSKLEYAVKTRTPSYNYLKNFNEYLDTSSGYLNGTNYYNGSTRVLDANNLKEALITILYYSKINNWDFNTTQNYIWILTNEFSSKYSLLPDVKYTDILGKENLVLEIYESQEQAQNLISLKFVEIFKTNKKNETLPGAKLQLYDTSDVLLHSWTSADAPFCVSLDTGNYYIKEISAPNYYDISSDTYFEVKANGNVYISGKDVDFVTVINELATYSIPINKWNGDKSVKLAGAKFSLSGTTLEGNAYQNTNIVSLQTGNIEILKPGSYTLTETVPPTDYILNETPVNFDVTIDGKIKIDGSVVSSIDIINIKGYDVIFSKQNTKNTDELSGASLKLEGINGTVFDSITWTSSTSAKTVNLKPGNYKYSETAAPSGYNIADPISFTLNGNGTITINSNTSSDRKIVMKDYMRSFEVKIKKAKASGDFLEGAQLYVTGITSEGNSVTVGPWLSTTSDHIENLKPGDYSLIEQSAPSGYDVSSAIKFKVDMQGNVILDGKDEVLNDSRIIMTDNQTSQDKSFNVIISKQTSDGKELKGATLTISGALSTGSKITDITWTSGDAPLTIALKPGTYTLTEKKAPEGYNICNAIPFSVDSAGNVFANGVNMNGRINMVDFKTPEVQGNSIVNNYYQNGVNGGGVSSAITVIKQNAAGVRIADAQLAIYSTVDATTPVAFWATVADGTFTTPLVPGSYYLREVKAPEGYITAPDIPFTISETGELLYNNSPVPTKTIVMIDSLNSGVIPKNIKTGERNNTWLLFMPIPIIGILSWYYYKKRKVI